MNLANHLDLPGRQSLKFVVQNSNWIRKYLDCQPYRNFFISESEKYLFFFKQQEGQLKLKVAEAQTGNFKLELARDVLDRDFLKSSVSIFDFCEETGLLFLHMDIANEESYNVFTIDLKSKELRQITNFSQTISPKLSLDKKSVWCLHRTKTPTHELSSTLYKVDLKSAQAEKCFDDVHLKFKLNFSAPLETGDGRVFLFLDENYQRQRNQLFEVSSDFKTLTPCLPENEIRAYHSFARNKIKDDLIYFQSDYSGFENIRSYNIKTRVVNNVTDIKIKNECGFRDHDKNSFIFQIQNISHLGQSKILCHTLGGQEVSSDTFDGKVYILPHDSSLWAQLTSMERPPRIVKLAPQKSDGFSTIKYAGSQNELVHAQREVINYKSFDGLQIEGFLFTPKAKLRGAIIIAFYGGEDYYSAHYQMFLEQGIAVLSPAVRGSWGWGKEWETLIRGDLGGNEILDVIWAAKFLQKKLNLSPEHIGVEGGSHGGYATLRTLTLPPIFNGVSTEFKFGFGICWAGFADLTEFYKKSWISDWLEDFLGPYASSKDLYIDRSPLTHFDQLKTPLFVSHGRNDQRVPIDTMTEFLNKLSNSKIPHEILIQEGEGHKSGGIEKDLEIKERLFNFIEPFLIK